MNVAVRDADVAENRLVHSKTLSATLFRPMEVDGVYARTGLYEGVVEALSDYISLQREPDTEVFRFPPVMNRRHIEKNGYLKSFPNLLGCVCALHGTEAEIHEAVDRFNKGGDWTKSLAAADLVLTPASCYPVYPLAAERGAVPNGGWRFDVACDCFRREPSHDIDRLQSFRMREYVCIGSPEEVTDFRQRWMKRGVAMAAELGLPAEVDAASDPFFGRVGQMMAVDQIQKSLKFELLIPVRSRDKPTACMSFNNHRDHFGEVWGLRNAAGEVSHTACAAFGMDRLAVALFATHGLIVQDWPTKVRAALAL